LASIPSGKDSSKGTPPKPDDSGTLDFTGPYKTLPKPAAPPATAAAPQAPAAQARPAPAKPPETPAPKAASPQPAAPAAARARAPIPVLAKLDPEIEAAAILHANGESAEAKSRLSKSVRQEQPRAVAERMWLMLMDLNQVLDEKREFEARAVEFALKFKRSAPAWAAATDASSTMLRTGGGAYVSLTGKLSAESAANLEKVRAVAEKNRMLRIDFTKLQGADGAGCKLLLDLLQGIRKHGGEAMFTGEGVLLGALKNANRPGAREVDQALWLLRLELLQWQGRQQEFDDVALDFAVTYEVSPPSFETLPKPAASSPQAAETGADEATRAPKEFVDGGGAVIKQLMLAAASRQVVVLDLSRTARVDFATAGALLDLSAKLEANGKQLELRRPSELVLALFEVIGVGVHAKLVARK
jgi:anti-anti-sigma regulatory factor